MIVNPKISPHMLSPTATSKNLDRDDAALREVSKKLETTFLAEMLKHSGLGNQSSTFGGGVGEEQFRSFLVHAQAEHMVNAGGIGLAEHLFNALKER